MKTPIPPSGRDFEVYRLRFVEGRSTREAAEVVKLSQTRVCKITDKVGRYLTTVAPLKDASSREQQLAVAEQVAALQVSFLYGAALQSWRASQGTQTIIRQAATATQPPATITTTRKSFGDCRYLLLAAKLATMSARLPIPCLELQTAGGDDVDTDEPIASHSPLGDCSPGTATCSETIALAVTKPHVNHSADDSYDPSPDHAFYDRQEFFAPVHSSTTTGNEDLLSFATAQRSPPLSRRQRRQRQKLLERKLNKPR